MSPGDGDTDEVAFGPPARRAGWLGFALLTTGLVAGLVLGWLLAPAQRDDGHETLIAGPVEMTGRAGTDGPLFALRLHNAGGEAVEVTGLRFIGLGDLEGVTQGSLAAGGRGSLTFAAPDDCAAVPSSLASARLTLRGGDAEVRVPVPGKGRELLEYHAARCTEPRTPRFDDLVGTWVLVDAYGEQQPVGSVIWRFDHDGGFVADSGRTVRGRYALASGELAIAAEGGTACDPGEGSFWVPSAVPGDPRLLRVTWVRGTCPADMTGQIWVLRRAPS